MDEAMLDHLLHRLMYFPQKNRRGQRKMAGEERVYFIRDVETRAIKVGVAINVRSRLRQLQTGNSSRLELLGAVPGGYAKEGELHARWAQYRGRGEWFMPDPVFVAEVWALLAAEDTMRLPGVSAV